MAIWNIQVVDSKSWNWWESKVIAKQQKNFRLFLIFSFVSISKNPDHNNFWIFSSKDIFFFFFLFLTKIIVLLCFIRFDFDYIDLKKSLVSFFFSFFLHIS